MIPNLMSKIYIGYVVEVIKDINEEPTFDLRVRIPTVHGANSNVGIKDKNLPIAKPLVMPGSIIDKAKFSEFINNIKVVYIFFDKGNKNFPLYIGFKGNQNNFDISGDFSGYLYWKGAWHDDITYNLNDMISHAGNLYRALQETINDDPETEFEYWEELVRGDLTGGTVFLEDTATSTLNVTFQPSKDITYENGTVNTLNITVPDTVVHGTYGGINFTSGSSPDPVSITNNSSFPIKLLKFGLSIGTYTPIANKVINLLFFCDGINIMVYITEVS